MEILKKYIPKESLPQIKKWIEELGVIVKISKARKTKLGDFRLLEDGKCQISINNNLNKYAFLITITHELAHAFVWKKYKQSVLPHGKEWKQIFRQMMLCFITPNVFPNNILKALSNHLLNPKASSLADIKLEKVIRNYDKYKKLTITDVMDGATFITQNKKAFVKIGRIRKRYKCQEIATGKIYLFNPLAIVNLSHTD